MMLPVQKSEICCHLDFHPPLSLEMFLGYQEIEPIALVNVFSYKTAGPFE